MIEPDYINLLLNQGFAIAVSIYLLYERTTVTKEVLRIMERLTGILDELQEKIRKE